MSRSFGWRAVPEPAPDLPQGEMDLHLAGILGSFLDPMGQYADDHAGSLDGETLEGTTVVAFLSGLVAGQELHGGEAEQARDILTALVHHGRVEIEVRR